MTKEFEIIRPQQKYSKPKPAPPMPWTQRLVRLAFGILGRIFPKVFSKIGFRLFATPQKKARHKHSDPILESAKISDLLYGKNMLKIYEWGSGSRTILLVHGWESRGTALRFFVPKLLKAGFHVIAFDAPAHGDSSGKRTNLPHFAGAVKAMLHRFGNVESIIAHSFGGATSIYAMVKLDPNLALKRLVLVGMPARMRFVIDHALDAMNAPPKVRKYFIRHLEKIADMPLDAMDIGHLNSKLKVDAAMIVHDRGDKVAPFADAAAVTQKWNKTELLETEGFGHYHILKSPEVVRRVVDFLK